MNTTTTTPRPALFRLYFGAAISPARQSVAGCASVGPEEWRSFVRFNVGPSFPDGWTEEAPARGAWRDHDTGEPIEEGCRIVAIVALAEDVQDIRRRVWDVAMAYARRFGQDAVLVVETEATSVLFVGPEPAAG